MLWVIWVELSAGQWGAEAPLESRGWSGTEAENGGDLRRRAEKGGPRTARGSIQI